MDKLFHFGIQGIKFQLLMLLYNIFVITGIIVRASLISSFRENPKQYITSISTLYFIITIPIGGWLYCKIPARQFRQKNVKLMNVSDKE